MAPPLKSFTKLLGKSIKPVAANELDDYDATRRMLHKEKPRLIDDVDEQEALDHYAFRVFEGEKGLGYPNLIDTELYDPLTGYRIAEYLSQPKANFMIEGQQPFHLEDISDPSQAIDIESIAAQLKRKLNPEENQVVSLHGAEGKQLRSLEPNISSIDRRTNYHDVWDKLAIKSSLLDAAEKGSRKFSFPTPDVIYGRYPDVLSGSFPNLDVVHPYEEMPKNIKKFIKDISGINPKINSISIGEGTDLSSIADENIRMELRDALKSNSVESWAPSINTLQNLFSKREQDKHSSALYDQVLDTLGFSRTNQNKLEQLLSRDAEDEFKSKNIKAILGDKVWEAYLRDREFWKNNADRPFKEVSKLMGRSYQKDKDLILPIEHPDINPNYGSRLEKHMNDFNSKVLDILNPSISYKPSYHYKYFDLTDDISEALKTKKFARGGLVGSDLELSSLRDLAHTMPDNYRIRP